MEIPVLIEPVAGNGYRARTGDPLALTAEGATPAEALANLRSILQERLDGGARLVSPGDAGPGQSLDGNGRHIQKRPAVRRLAASHR